MKKRNTINLIINALMILIAIYLVIQNYTYNIGKITFVQFVAISIVISIAIISTLWTIKQDIMIINEKVIKLNYTENKLLENEKDEKNISNFILKLIADRESYINQFFHNVKTKHTKEGLYNFLDKQMNLFRNGGRSWDISIIAFKKDKDRKCFFHPSKNRINDPMTTLWPHEDPYDSILKQDNYGELSIINRKYSEKINFYFKNENYKNSRYTKYYYDFISKLNIMVILESHINIVANVKKSEEFISYEKPKL